MKEFLILVLVLLQSRISVSNVTNDTIASEQSGFGMRFVVPFTDMNIQSLTNLLIIKDVAGQQIFLLHGTELYKLILERERKMVTLIGNLEKSRTDLQLLGAEIISWRHLFLLVVALEDHLEVYQFSTETLMRDLSSDSAAKHPPMDSIQQILLYGRYRKLFLCQSSEDSVSLIVLVNVNKLSSRIHTYEWSNTYFDPIGETTIAPVQDINLIGSDTKYIITSRLSRSRTKITVTTYSILPILKRIQVMQLLPDLVHPFTYQDNNYLLTCAKGHSKCTSFKMSDEQFVLFKRRPATEVTFSHFTAGAHVLVGVKDDKVSVYLNPRLECYGTFRTDTKNITSIMTHINQDGSHFVLLNYIRNDSTLLRLVEVEFEQMLSSQLNEDTDDDDEVVDPLKHQRHAFEESIAKLRKILLSQKYAFDEIRQTIQSKSMNVVYRNPIRIYSGNIGIVKLVGSKLKSPVQILQRLQAISNGERKTRFSRGFVDDFNRTSTISLKVKNLKVGNLILENDLVPGFNLSYELDRLEISVPVTTKVLETYELLTARILPNPRSNRFSTRSVTDESTMSIRNLKAKRINGVLWEDFYQNVFLRSRDRSINGRLIIQSAAEIDNLDAELLNGLPTKSLFDIVSDQNITSDIVLSMFMTSDLRANLVNGLVIERDVALKGMDNIVNSPVVAQDINVTGVFILAESDERARHIFGTSVLDLQQTYTGKVTIEGSLTLVNVFVEDQQKTRVVVGGEEISPNIETNFWMKSISQQFEQPISFLDCNISAPAVNTIQLNGHDISDYLLTTAEESPKPILLIFLSAHINGNLKADEELGTKLRLLNKTALKKSDPLIVSGQKVFLGSLTFDHGEIEFFNQLPARDLIPVSRKVINFTGSKTFQSIHVTNSATISEHLNADQLNGDSPADDHSKIDDQFGSIVLTSTLKAHNIEFGFINGLSADEIFSRIHKHGDDLVLNKDLFIEGSLEFSGDLDVDRINGIDWKDYLASLVRSNENSVISGSKTFASDLTIVTELITPTINDHVIDDLFGNVLLKSQYQEISGTYTFDTLKVDNINVPDINGFPTSDFINTRSPKVILNSDVIMNHLNVRGSLFGATDVDFHSIQSRINSILSKPWKNLYVLGDARWPLGDDQQSADLQYIFDNAVRHFDDQIITGNVKLKKPLINTMTTKDIFPKDIDFNHIATDCLFHNNSVQEVVLASKVFLKPLQFTDISALRHFGPKIINGIDIIHFNSSLYRVSQPSVIYGTLDFRVPPVFGYLTVQGLVNHMPTDHIFLAYNDRIWPPVKINNLHIDGHLQLFDIDHMNLNFLLQNRVRLSGPAQEIFGHLTFEHLQLNKNILLQSINGISLDNVVQKSSETLQEITGTKTIEGALKLMGPAMVAKLNGIDLLERYKQTVFLDKNYNFEHLSIKNATFKDSLIVSSPASKDQVGDFIQNDTYRESFKLHSQRLKNIETRLRSAENSIDTKAVNLKRLVYLDYDFSTLIEWKLRNDSIQEQFTFDNNRYTYCDREQTIVKWSRYHNRISLSKTITNTITADEYGIQVTADNNCKEGHRNANSLITITDPHLSKRFVLDKLVHSLEIYAGSIDMFVMIHGIDFYGGNNEIRFLKIDSSFKTVRDWQLLTDGVGKVSRLFKLTSHTILVVSTVIENYPSITIYNFNPITQIFDMVQNIDGDFNIIELAQVAQHYYHLLLSCVHCQKIVIFEYDDSISTAESSLSVDAPSCQMYHIYQIIKLKTRIDRYHIFTLSDGGIYLLVLSDQDIDFYHFYKYQFIQGWKHFTYGYFKDIQNAYPLLKNCISTVDDNLLLLCNRKCSLVKAYYQL